MSEVDVLLFERIAAELGGLSPGAVIFSGPAQVLPSVFEVSALASATVGAATASVAALWAARAGSAPR